MTPRLLNLIAAASLGVMVAALIVGDVTLIGTALATAAGFWLGADFLRKAQR